MRVLIISHTYLSAHYRGKLRWLATTGGLDLTLLGVPTLRLPAGPCLTFEERPEPFTVCLLQPLWYPDNNVLRLYSPAQVVKLLQNFKPDVVHVEAEPHTLTLALLAYLKPRFQYSLVAFTWENIYRRGRKPMAWLEPFSLRRVDWMITGNYEASQVIKWRGYNGPTSVVPQVGIDTAYFQKSSVLPELFEKCADGFKIGFVGRLVPEKGVLDLWEAFRPLAGQGYLLLFGEGPLRETLQQQALAAGLHDRVLLPGFIPHQQISAYFQGLDVLVLPSQTRPHWKEQFGQVLIEAMFSGVPVIGSDSGAIPEVIGEAGLIFPEQDVERLRQQLIYLLETPEKQKQLADAGKKRVLAHFTEDAVAQLTLAVYQEVLRRREKSK